MSRRAPRCSKSRPDSCSGSQSIGSTPPVIWGWPLIHGWSGRLISFRSEVKRPRDWECWVLFLTGRVACPSETEYCCISSSTVQWWTTRAPSAGPSLAPMSGSCRYFNPSVFALLPLHLGTLVTRSSQGFASSILRRPHQSPNREFRLKVSWCWEPLFSELGRY